MKVQLFKKPFVLIIMLFAASLIIISCQKEIPKQASSSNGEFAAAANQAHGHLQQTKTYSSEVAVKWMEMQIRLMSATTGVANVAFARPYAYSGIALYEAVVQGMPAYQSIASQLSGLSGLPQTENGYAYHWAASANAALAYINKQMFPNASSANKAAIDSLENALNAEYSNEVGTTVINRSNTFGQTIAQKIFDWAETDGYLHANDAYTPEIGPGLWVPPSIPLPSGSTPHWGELRTLVPGSGNNAQPGPPPAYSEDPSSDFYEMVTEVYDASPTPGTNEYYMALWWRDVPGTTTPGHYVSILKQVLENDQPTLEIAAIAYALAGINVYDAAVSCWQTKYYYNLVRPITYIRNVLGHSTWSPLLSTPAHPEYSSAHAVLSAANAEALTQIFGENHPFTDHTFEYLGWPSRSYSSFTALGEEAGNSRLYAGIHYQNSINAGLQQGRTVAENISSKLKFLKD